MSDRIPPHIQRQVQRLYDQGVRILPGLTGPKTDPVFDAVRAAATAEELRDPIDTAYQHDQAARKGAPVVTAEKTRTRTLVTSGDPDALFRVPKVIEPDEEFGDGDDIEQIGRALIASDSHGLSHLAYASIGYLWKGKGGKSKGRPTLSKTVKPSGLTAFYTDHEFVVWLAADTIDAAALTNWQVEALVYHELSSIRVAETDDDDAEETLVIVAPDVQENHDVIRLYGEYNASLQRAQDVFQARMELAGL